jgi:hypothetical protein
MYPGGYTPYICGFREEFLATITGLSTGRKRIVTERLDFLGDGCVPPRTR